MSQYNETDDTVDRSPRPGEPDGFDRLWTPHRMAYIKGNDSTASDDQDDVCPFCSIPTMADDDGLIVHRGETCFVVLNLYPYNPGHLMVVPFRHVADYTELTDLEVREVADFTRQAMRMIRAVSRPAGFNIGMNQGAVAGAGIAAHLHQHVVPRWRGDVNFLPIIGRTKAMPELLGDTRAKYAAAWADAAE